MKRNGTWFYEKNSEFPVEQSYLTSMASQFQKIEAVRKLKNGDSLEDYGLEHPAYTIRVKDKKGNTDDLLYRQCLRRQLLSDAG